MKLSPLHSGGCCKSELQKCAAAKQGSRDSQLLSGSLHQKAMTLTWSCPSRKCPKGVLELCFYFSIPLLPITITEDAATPLALIHPKPHGFSIRLTIFIDTLMGPPLLNTRTKTSYSLACMTDGQKSALSRHSRSISTFIWQHMLLLFTRSDHTGYWLTLQQPVCCFFSSLA